MDSFAEVVENTRHLSLSQEREVRSVPSSPALPPLCSSKLKLIIERQLCLGQSQSEDQPERLALHLPLLLPQDQEETAEGEREGRKGGSGSYSYCFVMGK